MSAKARILALAAFVLCCTVLSVASSTNNTAEAAASADSAQAAKKPGAAALANQATATDAKPHNERLQSSKTAAILFWLFALSIIGGAIFVITRRNLVAAVMGMVGTFFAIAAIYVMLYATFLAALQVLVYAGAIMVLFVFVIMFVNRPEDEIGSRQSSFGKVAAVLATLYLLMRVGGVLWGVSPPDNSQASRPDAVQIMGAYVTSDGDEIAAQSADFGSVAAVGSTMFRDYLFPFEAVSLILLVAVIGAIAVARPNKKRETLVADTSADARTA